MMLASKTECDKLIEDLFRELKQRIPLFEIYEYPSSKTKYYGYNKILGYKYYEKDNIFHLDVKRINGNKYEWVTHILPSQFFLAKKAIKTFFGIKDTTITDKLTNLHHELIQHLHNSLHQKGILFTSKQQLNRVSYYFGDDDVYSAFWIMFSESQPVLKIKKSVPLDNQNNEEPYQLDLVGENIDETTKLIEKLYKAYNFYDEISKHSHKETFDELIVGSGLTVLRTFATGTDFSIILTQGKKLVIKKRRDKTFVVSIINDQEVNICSFSEDGIIEAIESLLENNSITTLINDSRMVETDCQNNHPTPEPIRKAIKESQKIDFQDTSQTEKTSSISDNALSFISEVNSLPHNVDNDTIQLLFELYDQLDDDDCDHNDIKESYDLLNQFFNQSFVSRESKRFVYISKSFRKEIDNLETEIKDAINNIQQALISLDIKDLYQYFKSKRLVYLGDYYKIRVKNGCKHRIIFCFGDTIGKNGQDLYLFEYIDNHDFSNVVNLKPETQQYELWKKSNVRVSIPPLSKRQDEIAKSIEKPIICTGCAGSGKTLISIYMYCHLIDKYYALEASISSKELVYVTYNEFAMRNALNQLKEIVEQVNVRTIFDFFYEIAKHDLINMKYVDETSFFDWWKNKISDHQLKKKMESLTISNPERYVYTFFRGLFKGSMFRWEVDINTSSLSKHQFFELMQTEPVDKNDYELLFDICESYQQYLIDNHLFDDNDLARRVIRRISKGIKANYQHIILDEVQDLTEVQLDAIVKCSVNQKQIYFFGDQNQSINPTLFNLDLIEMSLIKNGGLIKPEDISRLNNSYRFGPLLADYINFLTNKKRSWIGTKAIDENEVSSINTELDRWAGRSKNHKVIDTLLMKASNSANAIIIVPDDKTRALLEQKYGAKFIERVTTIYDSKGLEWDYVVMYGMLSFNQDKYLEMIAGKGKKSTLHRMIFNQYYVGCTRSRVCFTVLEESLSSEIEKQLLEPLPTIQQDSIDLYISEDNDPASWLLEAERLFEQGVYILAVNAFRKAALTNDEEPRLLVCEIMNDSKKSTDLDNATLLKNKHYYREAKQIYLNANQTRLARLMDLYSGVNISDGDLVDLLNNETLGEEDMTTITNLGYFNKKSNSLRTKLNALKTLLIEGNKL